MAPKKKPNKPNADGNIENGKLGAAKNLGGKAFGKVGGFVDDFKNFINQGNAFDLAVAFIMGVAFSNIISSLVDDIFDPCISMAIQISLENIFWVMKHPNATKTPFETLEDAKKAGAITLNYGRFGNQILRFIVVAFCLFFLMKIMFMFKLTEEPVQTVDCPKCKEPFKEGATRCPHCTCDFERKRNPYVIPNDDLH